MDLKKELAELDQLANGAGQKNELKIAAKVMAIQAHLFVLISALKE